MKKIRVGIIGTGFTVGISKNHLKAYLKNPECEVTALFDIVPGRSKIWADQVGLDNVKHCESLKELFDLTDLVSICTPNDTHASIMIEAMKAGKHFLCEKPAVADETELIPVLKEAALHPDLTMLVCYNYREIPAIKYIKKILDSGRMGEIFTIRQRLGGARMSNTGVVKLEWRMKNETSGLGALADFGCHMIDLAEYLGGEYIGNIRKVGAATVRTVRQRPDEKTGKMLPVENDDSASFFASTDKDVLLEFSASRISNPGHYLEISGTGGVLIYDTTIGRDKVVTIYNECGKGIDLKNRKVEDVPPELCGEDHHIGIVNRLIEEIQTGKKDARTLQHGMHIQHLLTVLGEASEKGRTIDLRLTRKIVT